ncbi:hypothetical protein HPB48_013855 [Haemaphysalis longicornis]|uniref:Uncharacterized protein n=1 Tax=Haemaphysalis longicornis TaxID=44386 RepID=A0A9J6GK64_HAELO|nr:hypothetical protein HPB48_013855 [Haemaphysalis longicornis]
MPRELYFQDEGGRRWVIRCSPSDSAPESYLRKREPSYGRCSRAANGALPAALRYVQYTNGGPRMQGSGKPTLSVADPRKGHSNASRFGVGCEHRNPSSNGHGALASPPSGLFPDVPDWILRISRGRKHRASSRGSAPSERAHAEEHTSSSGSTKRPTKKKSEVSFREEEERLSGTKPEPEAAPPQPERKQEPETTATPALTPPMQQSLAPPPIIPRRKTEESFLHEFFEEMDERGMAALTARSDKRRRRKTSAVSGELGGPPQLSLNTEQATQDTGIKHLQPPEGQAELPSPEINDGGEAKGRKRIKLFSAKVEPKAAFATAAEARIVKGDRKASGKQDKAAIGGPLATAIRRTRTTRCSRKRPASSTGADPLSYKCPTLQEVVGYAIVTAVVLLGLVLLVSVPRMRSPETTTSSNAGEMERAQRHKGKEVAESERLAGEELEKEKEKRRAERRAERIQERQERRKMHEDKLQAHPRGPGVQAIKRCTLGGTCFHDCLFILNNNVPEHWQNQTLLSVAFNVEQYASIKTDFVAASSLAPILDFNFSLLTSASARKRLSSLDVPL